MQEALTPQAEPRCLPLDAYEARVLAVLIEKRHTVPDSYPMTVNSLLAGCNQKSSRDPVLELTEADVHAALERLRGKALAIESSGGRVMRWSENAKRVLGIPAESVAALAVLMLRGPQTPAELRANTERLYRFSDISALEAFLDELGQRGLVLQLPRAPGAREVRWVHTLCGAPVAQAAVTPEPPEPGLLERVAALELALAKLRADVAAWQTVSTRVQEGDA